MTEQSFLEKFVTIFDDTDPALITLDTNFRELEEWDSMRALSLIALADEEYEVKIGGDDIRSSTTVRDLHAKINAKIKA